MAAKPKPAGQGGRQPMKFTEDIWYRPVRQAMLLMIPGFLWVILDNGYTVGDQALYKLIAHELYSYLACDTGNWVNACFFVMGPKAPLLWWLGQFFIPIGMAFGSISKGLLMLPLLTEFIILVVTWKIFYRLFNERWIASLGVFLMAGSKLLLVMSTQFWTEPNRLMITVLVIYVVLHERRYDNLKFLLVLILLFGVSLLDKSTGPIFAFVPFCYGAYLFIRKTHREAWSLQRGHIPWLLGLGLVAWLAITWYSENFTHVKNWILYASTSSNYHAVESQGMFDILFYWLKIIARQLVSLPLLACLLVAAGYALKNRRKGIRLKNDRLFIWLCALQVLIALVLFVQTSNPVVRYVLPLLPYLLILALALIVQARQANLQRAVLALAILNFAYGYACMFGAYRWVGEIPDFYRYIQWEKSEYERLAELPDLDAETALFCAIHPEINVKILEFFYLENQAGACAYFEAPEMFDVEIEVDMLNFDGVMTAEPDSLIARMAQYDKVYYIMHHDRTSLLQETKDDFGWHNLLTKTEEMNRRVEESERFELMEDHSVGVFKVYRYRGPA